MTQEDFWNKIIITAEEKEKSIFYLKYRGICEHEEVRQYLYSITSRTISYSEIATAFRYDKRIRRTLYKYIGLLEESIRAYISNKYEDSIDKLKITSKLEEKFDEYDSLFVALSELSFGQLIDQTIRLCKEDRTNLFPYYKKSLKDLPQDLYAIVDLRNEISHNRFLLDGKNLKKCSVDNGKISILNNIINLRNCLQDEFREKFTQDINDCSKSGNTNEKHQVDWLLLDEIIIKL